MMMFKRWRQSGTKDDYERYRNLKSLAKRSVAAAKVAHYNCLYEDLDTPEGANKIYRLASTRHHATQDTRHVKNIKDNHGQILRDPSAILQRWSEHFSAICNVEFLHPPIHPADPVLGPVFLISPQEVGKALMKIKNGKAPRPDDIPTEAWKLLGG
ncbi:uncharacterized protein [Centruroides vittatus]|uniref:uncharacterized protein n=1 Tax=Centruroides vittatus TaxID=120091 RepID=UPI00350F42AA